MRSVAGEAVLRRDPVAAAGHTPRLDIQALRALAVAVVVVFHFWPSVLPGGFVGVDVFFVISGFLITGTLVRRPPQGIAGLTEFWARRALRLVPAVTLTLGASLATVVLFLPRAAWETAARHAWTSMLYVQNWRLVDDETDYLRAEGTPSVFQHFWSLSVEEQFYIAWPVVIGLTVVAAVRRRWSRRRALAVVVGLLTALSFAYNLSISWTEPALAYFSTFTRVWELGLGALLAIGWTRLRWTGSSRIASLLAAASLGGILLSSALLDKTSVFPGWSALVPTVCAAVFLVVGESVAGPVRRLVHARGVQLVGDTSYAVYLWHWPLLLLLPLVLDVAPTTWLKLALLPAVLLLAWLSTTLVEDRIRAGAHTTRVRQKGLLVMVGSALVVVAASLAMSVQLDRSVADSQRRLASLSTSSVLEPSCLGAGAWDPALDCEDSGEVLTPPETMSADIPSSIKVGECLNWPPFGELVRCTLGRDRDPVKRIALYGNSHAGHWQPALEAIAETHDFQLDTYVIGVCQPTVLNSRAPSVDPVEIANCDRLQEDALDDLTGTGYDLVVMSTMDHDTRDPEVYGTTLSRLREADVPVLVLRDTPAPLDPDNPPPNCVAFHLQDLQACGGTPQDWVRQDPLHDAAEAAADPSTATVDLNQHLCRDGFCPPVIGGVIVYADYNHMSGTFNRSLAPYLEPHLLQALDPSR